ncbi:BA14K family protein [Rhizobium sp. ARZ01]|uniref:BA14K family protein n=1 Tax=Rhizobium sp. ARZ01 TaxID=2769313 RepID=UPI001784AADA|nr:BA14K family protein [Rhizobium sp. ARZ01]MBD9374017.1 BA14K family protein [Rhizobium sp. ARZ01]
MRKLLVILSSVLLGACLSSAGPVPALAIDALRSPNDATLLGGGDPVDVFNRGGDPIDTLRGGSRYHRGFLGSRFYRDGYFRYRDGYWYPRSAFSTGELLGDVTVGPGAPVYGMTAEQWCANRYRSYRLSDNTYLPRTGGPRVQCMPQ